MLTQRRKPQSTSLLGHTGTMSPGFASDLCSLPSGPYRLSLELHLCRSPEPRARCPTEMVTHCLLHWTQPDPLRPQFPRSVPSTFSFS